MKEALKNQSVVVFGASGRVGADVCKYLARQGADIAVHYYSNISNAEKIVNEIKSFGGHAYSLQADLSNLYEVNSCVENVVKHLGKVDAVVNMMHKDKEFTPVLVSDMDWERDWIPHVDSMKVNFYICKAIIPYMRKQKHGRIVYVSGGLAFRFFEGCSQFSAIKSGINAFCKSLALEEGKNNITVNIVAPGKVVRPGDGIKDISGQWKEIEAKQLRNNPLGRFCIPEDVASAIAGFLIPSASYITGQTIYLAGGEIMPMP